MEIRKMIDHFVLKYLAVPRPPKVSEDKKLVACIGDSITFGAGVQGRKEKTWEYYLNEILGDKIQVLNYGISGRTLQKEGDYPYTAEKFYDISRQLRADIYLIMLGTNDAKPYNWKKDRYHEELITFSKSYLMTGGKVILMTPPMCFPEEKTGVVAFDIDEKTINDIVPEIVRKAAEELSLPLIDLRSFTEGHSEWFDDGVHPNAEGNKAIAGYIAEELKKK